MRAPWAAEIRCRHQACIWRSHRHLLDDKAVVIFRALFRNCWHLTWRSDHVLSLLTSLAHFSIEIGIKVSTSPWLILIPPYPSISFLFSLPLFYEAQAMCLNHLKLFLQPATLHFSACLHSRCPLLRDLSPWAGPPKQRHLAGGLTHPLPYSFPSVL